MTREPPPAREGTVAVTPAATADPAAPNVIPLLDRIARSAAARSDAAGLAASVLDALVRGLRADGAKIYRVDGDQLVELAVTPAPAPGASRAPAALPLPGTANAELLAMSSARGWLAPREAIGDTSSGDCASDALALASAPIPSRGVALGLIHLYRDGADARGFNEEELALLSTAACQLGPGLELALRGEGIDERAGARFSVFHRIAAQAGAALEIGAVVDSCTRLARELSGADWATVYIVDEERRRLELAAGIPLHSGTLDLRTVPLELASALLSQSRPTFLRLAQVSSPYREVCEGAGVRMAMTLPLMVGGRTVGLVALGFRTERRFDGDSLEALTLMAEQQAVALECARSQERSRSRARLASLLREAAAGALSASTEAQTWDVLLDAAVRVCGSAAAFMALVDAKGGLEVVASWSGGALHALPPLGDGDPLLSRCRDVTQPLHFEVDAELLDGSAWAAPLRHAGLPSLMMLPLRPRGALAGVIALAQRAARHFTAEEMEAKGLLASVAANALAARREQRAADEQRARLRQIVEHLPLPAAVLDAAGRFEEVNAAYREILPAASVGRLWSEAAATIDLRGVAGASVPVDKLHVPRAMRGETPPPSDLRLRARDGRWHHLLTHTAPLRGPGGELTGVTIAIQDVTTLRELGEAKDRFIDMASHELRAPLTNLKACAALLEMDPSARTSEERRRKLIDRLNAQVDRLSRLVDDLAEVARVRGGLMRLSRERVDLVELCREVAELAQLTTPDRRKVVVVADEASVGNWDRQRIAQVITNLVSNAARYSPSGSEVRVMVGGDAAAARVTVEDQGMGIDPELLGRLFEPYVRGDGADKAARGGLGLGLHISQEIVRHHEGRIDVESQPGRGSRFTVLLPRAL